MEQRYLHMTFFWGRKTEVLFRGWPGDRGGMYALALVVMFLATSLIELLSCPRLRGLVQRRRRVLAGLYQTAVHALRVGLAYLIMLALMSFNVGVVLAAVAGAAAGFLLVSSLRPEREASSSPACRRGTGEI